MIIQTTHPPTKPILRILSILQILILTKSLIPSIPHILIQTKSQPITPIKQNHSSDDRPKLITNPYRAYADLHCASDGESIYRSIVRRASDSPTLGNAKYKAGELIADFNRFARDCDPEHQPVSVPDDLLAKSLTQRMEAPETYIFDPGEYYDLDRDDFYFCLCRGCDECDELEFYIEFIEELEEETAHLLEDP